MYLIYTSICDLCLYDIQASVRVTDRGPGQTKPDLARTQAQTQTHTHRTCLRSDTALGMGKSGQCRGTLSAR
jgi:hypothetical protein